MYVQITGFDSFPFFSPWLHPKAQLLVMIGMIVWKCCFASGHPAQWGPCGFPVAKWDDPAAEATRPMATHNRITRFD